MGITGVLSSDLSLVLYFSCAAIATATGWTVRDSNPDRGETPHQSRPALGPTQPPAFPGDKAAKAWRRPPASIIKSENSTIALTYEYVLNRLRAQPLQFI